MAKVVTPVTAKVEFITQEKQGDYGPYRSVLFLNEVTGDKIWKSFDPDSEELALLTKGARVQLIETGKSKSGKISHNIVLLERLPAPTIPATAPAPDPLPTHQGIVLHPDEKRAIATFGTDIIKAYGFLYGEAKRVLEPLGASEETIRAAASSALIACQRKLSFDR